MRHNAIMLLCVVSFSAMHADADNARFRVSVVDSSTGAPIAGVVVRGTFTDKYVRWENTREYHDYDVVSGRDGVCHFKGRTNCGCAGFRIGLSTGKPWVDIPFVGQYYRTPWVDIPFAERDVMPFSWWQPDNLVITVCLQRVEHPVPLFVKRVRLRNGNRGIGGFDGTNSVIRFDMIKGDWLPPYGKGEITDLEFRSTVKINGRGWYLFEPGKYDWVYFYQLSTTARCPIASDGFNIIKPILGAGIKVRRGDDGPFRNNLSLMSIGRNQKFEKNGKDWSCQNYRENFKDRCVVFRIRSQFDDNGNLKAAYYGKIYDDIVIEGDDKRGLVGIEFLYYLNPTPLDRNLEWDMKNNLCPNPGMVGRQP